MLANNLSPLFPNPAPSIQELEDRLIISCGAASFILHRDGKIELRGTEFIQTTETIEMNARRVDICP